MRQECDALREKRGLEVDLAGFEAAMEEQRVRSRAGGQEGMGLASYGRTKASAEGSEALNTRREGDR
jgi:alanyl-tRNA synthetase